MPWIYLLLAGIFEIGFAIGLKYTEGFTRLWPSMGTIVAAGISLWLLTQALRTIPVGTAYAIWTGIGAGHAGRGAVFGKCFAGATGLHRADRGWRGGAEAVFTDLICPAIRYGRPRPSSAARRQPSVREWVAEAGVRRPVRPVRHGGLRRPS